MDLAKNSILKFPKRFGFLRISFTNLKFTSQSTVRNPSNRGSSQLRRKNFLATREKNFQHESSVNCHYLFFYFVRRLYKTCSFDNFSFENTSRLLVPMNPSKLHLQKIYTLVLKLLYYD